MHIRILETGEPPEPLKAQFGSYPEMMERVLAPIVPGFTFSVTSAHRGAQTPKLGDFDGLLITGSPAGVYEGYDWIAPAEDLVRRAAAAGKPVVGICFGHQLMAQAFGGKVEKSDKGWGVGIHAYDIVDTAEWMTPAAGRIACLVSHQDQVTEPPKGARVLGGSDFCPYAVLEYAHGSAISFQQHPEFAHEYAGALMRLRRGRIPEAIVDAGLNTLGDRSDRALVAQWIIAFFKRHAR